MAQKILIVEDNPDLSQILSFYLSGAGYETSRVGNSAEGISKALAERPDLIITDLYLPDMNAVDATVILKQDPATSGIPIVVLTAAWPAPLERHPEQASAAVNQHIERVEKKGLGLGAMVREQVERDAPSIVNSHNLAV